MTAYHGKRGPVEGCPQPETPIRERAWTAEQAIANLLDRALDAAAFLNAIKRNDRAEPLREAVHAVWPESAKSMDARFHLSSAFAATLCQQAEQPAVAVSGWDGEAYANMTGELESWKRRALQAEHFIEHEVQGQTFMGEPLLRAPAEQGGRVDEGMSIDLALGYAKAACIGPMSSQAIAVIESALAQNASEVDSDGCFTEADGSCSSAGPCIHSPEYAQNAQGEAVEAVPLSKWSADDLSFTQRYIRDWTPEHVKDYIRSLEAHAERARVPEITDVLAHWVIASVGDVPYATMTTEQVKAALRENLHLLAAPSHPEDAA